jgi:DNA polymerase-1
MFIPDAEKVFISADYSQAEARVVAYLARDSYLIELFSDPSRDIHRETAARIFNKPVEAVNDFERFVGKRVRHAVNYGMDADRFVEIVNEDAEETGFRIERGLAKRAIEGFFMMHPNHRPVFWGNVMAQIKATRTVSTAFGRKRMFFGRWGDDLLRSAYSHYPQGTIGDLCGKAMVRCYHEIELGEPSYGYELLLNVHDSIVAQCDEAHVPAAIEKMRECMNIPITVDGHTFTIPVDVAVGRNWRKAQKDGSNVDGLKEV